MGERPFSDQEALSIHAALHAPADSVVVRGRPWPIDSAGGAMRRVTVLGVQFATQNTRKRSTWAERALQGHKITWIIVPPACVAHPAEKKPAAPAAAAAAAEEVLPDDPRNWMTDPGWREALAGEFAKPYFGELLRYVCRARAGTRVYPPPQDVWSAFNLAPLDSVRVCVLGQDPYVNAGEAHGLCFSVRRGMRTPPSLSNIYDELARSVPGFARPAHGCLEAWARQGVLMLNASLTVEERKPNSHADCGWQRFTDEVVRVLVERRPGTVFMLWGAFAQRKGAAIDKDRCHVLVAAHPSPNAGNAFVGCGHFVKANEIIAAAGGTPIDWSPDAPANGAPVAAVAAAAPPPAALPLAAHAAPAEAPQNGDADPPKGRLAAPVEEILCLRDYLRFPQDFHPKGSCKQSLLDSADLLGIKDMQHLARMVSEFIDDMKFSDPPEAKLVSPDELFAIVAYTYDFGGHVVASENLYFKLNNDLRQRMKVKMEGWSTFLFYLLGGLSKLPSFSGTVYRGVKAESRAMVEKHYKLDRKVRWTGFTSTTDALTVASESFAGPGGVVFRIKTRSGKNIRSVSYIRGEGEILLSPNTTFRVKNPVHSEGKLLFLDLEEEPEEFVF
eukprot:m51a1_g4083 putative uracil-dna glycosylase (614) ;mRNA; f:28159-30449